MACADLARIINSDQVQGKLRAIRHSAFAAKTARKNPLKNRTLLQRLNPYSKVQRELEAKAVVARQEARKAALKHKHSKAGRQEKAARTKRHLALHAGLEASFAAAQKIIDDEDAAGRYNPNANYEENDE
jgi:large subunit ribosomal protein L4e